MFSLGNLSPNAFLFNADGATDCNAPAGTPFVRINTTSIPAFGTVRIGLEFDNNSSNTGITYIPWVFNLDGPP